jgi:maltose O-acetyltransferase
MLRGAGWSIGKRALILGVPRFRGTGSIQRRLTIGDDVIINEGCLIELVGRVTLGDGASIGHGVHLLTSTHRLGTGQRRAGLLESGDITVGAGAWIGSKAIVLPNVTIGEGAVVSANSLVSRDVPPNCLVAGVPAVVVVKRLPG